MDITDQLARAFSDARPLIPMYIHLILSAIFPIYTGAHASLSRPASAAKPDKKKKVADDLEDEDEDEDKIQKMEGMSNKDAIVLPVTAGIVLAGLYYLIMKYGADLINLILGWYFSAIGVYSVARFVNDGLEILANVLLPTYFGRSGSLWRISTSDTKFVNQDDQKKSRNGPDPFSFYVALPGPLRNLLWRFRRGLKQKDIVKIYIRDQLDLKAKLSDISVVSALVGIGTILYVNMVSKHWILTNLQGFAVSYSALQLMSPTTFATGSLILGALFCYDIWAVFFTPLMVTVAKNLDQPIKLVFPRPDEPGKTPDEPPVKAYSMLGLGDIVLPGIMIGLALRFDLYLYYLRKQKKTKKTEHTSDEHSTAGEVGKAPYVSLTGHWGDRLWTYWLPNSSLPTHLRSSFPKPYFTASMIGYLFGMLATLGVMSMFQHAQPALLYLVPGVLISLWGTGLVRGELNEMWNFSEALTGEQLEEADDKANGNTKNRDSDREKSQEVQPKGFFERLWHNLWGSSEDTSSKATDEKGDNSSASEKEKGEDADKLVEKKDEDGHEIFFSFSISRPDSKASTAVPSEQIADSKSKTS